MGRITIACYRPKPGKEPELSQLMREHVSMLQRESLASERAPIIMRAKDGTIIEVFEWATDDSADEAHSNPVVLEMWKRFNAACDYVKVSDIAETRDQWASFDPLESV